jgi:hypothetical protein
LGRLETLPHNNEALLLPLFGRYLHSLLRNVELKGAIVVYQFRNPYGPRIVDYDI